MIVIIIICAAAFTVGNIVWPFVGDPKLYYIPLSLMICSLMYYAKDNFKNSKRHDTNKGKYVSALLHYFFILSCGNVVKQITYTDTIRQINDYVFGAIVTVWLIHKLLYTWATQSRRSEKKSYHS